MVENGGNHQKPLTCNDPITDIENSKNAIKQQCDRSRTNVIPNGKPCIILHPMLENLAKKTHCTAACEHLGRNCCRRSLHLASLQGCRSHHGGKAAGQD